MEKSTPELKAELACIMRKVEKKNNNFEIHVIILRYKKNINFPFKKDFKFAELFTKTSFFFTLDAVLKMAKETDKIDVESTCARVTKHGSKKVAKAEVNVN